MNVVYVLQSKHYGKVYVGSTNAMAHRLANHNSSHNTTIATAWTRDWVLQACVNGFPLGEKGRSMAFRFEATVQRIPTVPDPPLDDVLSIVDKVISDWRKTHNLPLWMDC